MVTFLVTLHEPRCTIMFSSATEKRTYKWKHCSWNLILESSVYSGISNSFFSAADSSQHHILLSRLFFATCFIGSIITRAQKHHIFIDLQPFWYMASQRLWLKPLSLLWQIEEALSHNKFPEVKGSALTSPPKATPWYWEHDFRCQKKLE